MANQAEKQAKADYKAARAEVRSKRPWYKKKRILLPLILLLFIFISAMNMDNDDGSQLTNNEESTSVGSENRNQISNKEADETSGLTTSQKNAVRSAESYISMMGFSRQGLINQLSSDAGDKYSIEDATVAVDSLDIDYNEQAERSAESYLSMSGFSCQGLIDQLSSQAGDKYTAEQARSGAEAAGAC